MPGAVTDGHNRSLAQALLRGMTRVVTRFPVLTLLLMFGAAAASVVYTQRCLDLKTSRADLIDPNADYQKRWKSYTREFGDVADLVVVVESDSPAEIRNVLDDLGSRVEQEEHLFKNVLYKVDLSRLIQKGLQQRSPEELQFILARLEKFSLLLKGNQENGGKWNLFNLRSMFRDLRHELARADKLPPEYAAQVVVPLIQQIGLFSASMSRAIVNPDDYESPWPDVTQLTGSETQVSGRDRVPESPIHYAMNEKGTMGFLNAQAATKTSDFNGASPAIDRLRELMADVGRKHPSARLGLTGIPVLESDEMRSSQASMFVASVISFAGVAVLLLMGFRGVRHPLFAIIMLAVSMAWSFGFTTWAVGHLNILSVSFAAMLIGLGIDFAIVYLSRYLELRHHGEELLPALLDTAGSIGPGMITAAITTSVAFFAAMFTDFAGVAELGIIAGGGIILCLLGALLVLPALLTIFDRHRAECRLPNPFEGKTLKLLTLRYPVPVVAGCVATIVGVGVYSLRVKYDYNLLNLQAKGVDSVEVQRRIFDKADHSLLFAVSLADSQQQALELKQKFEALPSVRHVEEIASKLPAKQSEETQLLVQAVHAQLGNLPETVPPPGELDPSLIGKELELLEQMLEEYDSIPISNGVKQSITAFLTQLDQLPFERQMALLRQYQGRMKGDLLARFKMLASVSDPEPVNVDDLPPAWSSRYFSPRDKTAPSDEEQALQAAVTAPSVAPAGKWLLQVYPKEQIWDIEPLTRFIRDVRSVDPEATGTPLQTYEASHEIKQSYESVGVYALLAVCVVLLIDFRSVTDSLLALMPPAVGAIMMFGVLGLCHVDLNPANLIVLPLVVGIGVDGGVHMVHDFRSQRRRYKPSVSTYSAIFLNSTTTMVGFGSMMIAAHRGLYSLGLVLTVGVGCCLVVSLVLLPAVLAIISRQRLNARPIRLLPTPVRLADVTFAEPTPAHRPHLALSRSISSVEAN